MIKPVFSEAQANGLRIILDLAVKSGGLDVAAMAVSLDNEMRAAAQRYNDGTLIERAKAVAERNEPSAVVSAPILKDIQDQVNAQQTSEIAPADPS